MKIRKTRIPAIAIVGMLAVALPFIFNYGLNWNYGIQLACFFLLYTVAVSGLDILFGYSGQISMGHAAFYAIGAYGSVLLHEYTHLPIMLTMILAAALAALIGAALAYPSSKLVFHFLSLATIAFGEVVYQFLLQSPNGFTGNFLGKFTETINFFGISLNSYTRYYFFALGAAVLLLVAKQNLIHSRAGRAMIAIRENSHAANGMGINVRKYKVMAFAISAFYTAYAGSLYAHLVRYISPDTFAYKQSVMFVTMLLFGGTASWFGPMIGVLSVQALNEVLRSAEKYQTLIYGILLLLVIVLMPGGLASAVRKVLPAESKTKNEEGPAHVKN